MIDVVREPVEFDKLGLENCCLCEKPTPYWYEPHDVACCEVCAMTATPEAIPSKAEWVAKEGAKEKQ